MKIQDQNHNMEKVGGSEGCAILHCEEGEQAIFFEHPDGRRVTVNVAVSGSSMVLYLTPPTGEIRAVGPFTALGYFMPPATERQGGRCPKRDRGSE